MADSVLRLAIGFLLRRHRSSRGRRSDVVLLPESLQFLVLKGKQGPRVGKWLRRIAPQTPLRAHTRFVVREQKRAGMPFLQLFHEGRATTTILLWIINFMNLLNVFLLASWLPTVMRSAGYSTSTAVLVGTTLQVGAVVGTLVLGWWIEKFGFVRVLTICFVIACINVALIGKPGLPLFAAVCRGLHRRVVHHRRAARSKRALGDILSNRPPLHRHRLGTGHRPHRRDCRTGSRRRDDPANWSSQALFIAAAIPALISALVGVLASLGDAAAGDRGRQDRSSDPLALLL